MARTTKSSRTAAAAQATAPAAVAEAIAEAAAEAPTPAGPRTILVTGATGFVGGHIVRALREQGFRVRVLVRDVARLRRIEGQYDEVHQGDLTDPASLVGSCEGVAAVIHSACAVAGTFDAGTSAEAAFMRVNRDGTEAIAREVLKYPGLRLVHVSSTAAMGPPKESVVTEDSPCDPRTPYQRSKRAAEEVLLGLHAEHGLNVVMIRPCVVAGQGKEKSELLTLLRITQYALLPLPAGAERLTKPMIWIDDLVAALLLGIDRGNAGRIYFVHSDGHHTLGRIIDAAAKVWGRRKGYVRIPLAPFSVLASAFDAVRAKVPTWNPPLTRDRLRLLLMDRQIDISRARTELGYVPKVQDEYFMLQQTWQGYRDAGVL